MEELLLLQTSPPCFTAPGGAAGGAWNWKNVEYTGLAAYRLAAGNDGQARVQGGLIDIGADEAR